MEAKKSLEKSQFFKTVLTEIGKMQQDSIVKQKIDKKSSKQIRIVSGMKKTSFPYFATFFLDIQIPRL